MEFRVKITRSAEADIDAAYLWIFEQGPNLADRWIRGLYKSIFSLKEFPARCPVTQEGRELDREIRHLLYPIGRHDYRILYEIKGDSVFVLRIRHTARDNLELDDFDDG